MAKLSNQLRRASAELAHLESQLARLEARSSGKRLEVERLRLEVNRLQAAMEQESGGAAPTDTAGARGEAPQTSPPLEALQTSSAQPRTSTTRTGLPAARTEAIVAVLRRSPDPLTPTEITQALRDEGRSDQLKSVTATLTHLLKSHAVERVGRGVYVAVPAPSAAD